MKSKHDLDYKNEIEFQVISYITNLNLVDPSQVNMNTSIENDLGITGDDAFYFIEDFAREFTVDIQAFQYKKYFSPEGMSFLSFFEGKHALKTFDLTIKDLFQAAKTGKFSNDNQL